MELATGACNTNDAQTTPILSRWLSPSPLGLKVPWSGEIRTGRGASPPLQEEDGNFRGPVICSPQFCFLPLIDSRTHGVVRNTPHGFRPKAVSRAPPSAGRLCQNKPPSAMDCKRQAIIRTQWSNHILRNFVSSLAGQDQHWRSTDTDGSPRCSNTGCYSVCECSGAAVLSIISIEIL